MDKGYTTDQGSRDADDEQRDRRQDQEDTTYINDKALDEFVDYPSTQRVTPENQDPRDRQG